MTQRASVVILKSGDSPTKDPAQRNQTPETLGGAGRTRGMG